VRDGDRALERGREMGAQQRWAGIWWGPLALGVQKFSGFAGLGEGGGVKFKFHVRVKLHEKKCWTDFHGMH